MNKYSKPFRELGSLRAFRPLLTLGAALLLFTACQAPQPVAHHADTVSVDRYHYDSIDRWHTRHIHTAGDTVRLIDTFYVDRWHIRLRDSVRTVHDSVPYPVKVEVVKTETDVTGWTVAAVISLIFSLFVFLVSRATRPSR